MTESGLGSKEQSRINRLSVRLSFQVTWPLTNNSSSSGHDRESDGHAVAKFSAREGRQRALFSRRGRRARLTIYSACAAMRPREG